MEHTPVFLHEAVDALALEPDGSYLDATYGRGGHTAAILAKVSKQASLWAIDRDPEAQADAHRFSGDRRFQFIRMDFGQLKPGNPDGLLGVTLPERFDGILFDLGVSSPQLDQAHRGFSFLRSGPLDMRMDPTQSLTARKWLEFADEKSIFSAIATLGEERFAARIARKIVALRRTQPLVDTLQLSQLVASCLPHSTHKHPATRTFQAIRMVVNDEVNQLVLGLDAAVERLSARGRLVLITFHGLEERILKRVLGHSDKMLFQRQLKRLQILKSTPKSNKENRRARSATLYVFEKLTGQ